MSGAATPPVWSIRRSIILELCWALRVVAPVLRDPSAPVGQDFDRWLVVSDEGHETAGEYAEREAMKSLTLTVEGAVRGAATDDEAEALADALYCEAARVLFGDPGRGGLASDTRETSCVFAKTEGENSELIGLCTIGVSILFSADPADPRSAP